jgi:REP element-mobilizing transposase RayT
MGIIENAGGHLFRIGGMPDHIHLVVDIPSRVSLADFVKQIKQGSSNWLASNPDFANWRHWEEGYGAFTYAYKDLPHVVEYVKNQKIHHQKVSFADEYRALLDEYGIKYDERFMLR